LFSFFFLFLCMYTELSFYFFVCTSFFHSLFVQGFFKEYPAPASQAKRSVV
jgi:hypothetical protein